MIIKIENIPQDTTKHELRSLFRRFGRVTAIIKRPTHAFIHMPSNRRARIAADQLNKTRWKGNQVVVSEVDNTRSSTHCKTHLGVMRLF